MKSGPGLGRYQLGKRDIMGDQNKILDVTYGKFSCRLEGFDDAVETMKTVVSFFREMAGDQMFLEPTPPIPDVDAIARLAEQHAGGNVTAATDGNGLTLTRTTTDAEEEVSEDAADYEDVAEDATEEVAEDNVFATPEADQEWTADEPAEATADMAEDSDTLMIDAPVDLPDFSDVAEEGSFETESDEEPSFEVEAATDTEEQEEQQFTDAPVLGDPAMMDDAQDFDAQTTDQAEIEEDSTVMDYSFAETDAEGVAEDDVEQVDADEVMVEPATSESADEEQPAPLQDSSAEEESFATRLDRIRAMVSSGMATAEKPEETPSPTAPVVEETAEPAAQQQDDAPKPMNPLAQRLAELAKRNSELMDSDDVVAPEAFIADEGTVVAEADDEVTPVLADEGDQFEAEADVQMSEDDNADWDTDEDNVAEVEADASPLVLQDMDDDDDEDTDEPVLLTDEDTSPSAPAVRSEERPLLLTTPQPTPDPINTVEGDDDDDDFDLTAELAKVEEEIAARPRNDLSRHGLPRRVEDAMSRIFSQTNHQLDEPEGRRHRDALAQLKAAVAATEAAKQMGDTTKSRDVNETFRDDLGALRSGQAGKGQGLPPLKLVKSDLHEVSQSEVTKPRTTSRPLDVAAERLREIAATKEASKDAAQSMDFATFLSQHGVSDLADKLEAAAAYMAYVDGEADFTRPQLMRLVQSASASEITREDGLRCFGRLLRQSRFVKLSNGRFQVADNTRFKPRTSRLA